MKIWIDDRRPPPCGGWEWAKTSEEASKLFHENMEIVSAISFDHDLGGDDNPVRLADEIEELAAHGKLHPLEWYVHSGNPAGAKRLKQALEKADEHWWYKKDND